MIVVRVTFRLKNVVKFDKFINSILQTRFKCVLISTWHRSDANLRTWIKKKHKVKSKIFDRDKTNVFDCYANAIDWEVIPRLCKMLNCIKKKILWNTNITFTPLFSLGFFLNSFAQILIGHDKTELANYY